MYDPEQFPGNNRSEKPTQTPNERRLNSLAYAQEVLDQLERQTLQTITDPETRAFWLEKLSQVPQWKLLRLCDFTGRLEQVWKYFEEQKQPPQVYKPLSLPEPKRHDDLGKLCCTYLDVIFSDSASVGDKDWFERAWVAEMKDRFPHVKVYCQRVNNLG